MHFAIGLKKLFRRFDEYSWRRELIVVPLVAGALFWIFLGKYLDGQYSTAVWLDNTHFLLPLFAHISRTFARGEYPYWINSIAGGVPLYNTPQFSLLYPFYFFRSSLYHSPLETSLYVHYVTLLHVGFLWVNTYVMMRILRLRMLSSVLGATLFAYSANTDQYLFWVNIISPYSWFPLALASLVLILENRYPKTGLTLGLISVYLLTSASPAQPLIHLVCCCAFLVGSYALIHRKDIAKVIVPARNVVLLALGSILLCSTVLIPTLLFARKDMVRWTEAGAVVGNEKIPFKGFLTGQIRGREMAKVLFPLNIEQVSGDSWLGIIPVFLALFGLFRFKDHWIIVPFFVLALYTVLSSAGANLGLAYINYQIPLINKIREPARHLYVFALATCTLAAFGFEQLTDIERMRRVNWTKHAAVLCIFLVLLVGSYSVTHSYDLRMDTSTLLWSFALFVVLLIISPLLRVPTGVSGVVLAAVAVYPSFRYPAPIVKMQQGDYFDESNLRSHRVLEQVAKLPDIRNYRLVVADTRFSTQWWSMNGIYYDVRTFEAAMNPLPYKQVSEMTTAPEDLQYAKLLGAKYYLDCRDSPSPFSPSEANIRWPGMNVGSITLVNPKNGNKSVLGAGAHSLISDLTYSQGWVPLNQHGTQYQVINFARGQMFVDPDRGDRAAPLNVILGGPWSSVQLQALPEFLALNPQVHGGLELPISFSDRDSVAGELQIPADYVFQRGIEGCSLYSTSEASSHYFLSAGIDATYSDVQQFFSILQRTGSPKNKLLVSSNDGTKMAGWLAATREPLEWQTLREEASTNRITVDVKTNRRSVFVLNEVFSKEWQVQINGKAQQPFEVNLNQIAVLLPEGTNRIECEYRPRLFVGLWYIQLAAVALLGACVARAAANNVKAPLLR